MTELRAHIAQVLTDYRDGLLDSREDAVEAIMERIEEDALVVVPTMKARKPDLGPSISIGTRSAED